jgi:hypothetical protein
MTYHLEYLGFRNEETTREYHLLVRRADGQCYEFMLAVAQEAFLAGRVRYQDAAEICFWKMQRALEAWDSVPGSGPLATRQTVTEADLLEYRDAHAAKPRRFSPPSPPRPA